MGPQVGIPLAERSRAEVDAARRRELPRILDLVEPVLAAELGSGRDHQGRPRQGARLWLAGERDVESKSIAFAPEALRPAAKPSLDGKFAEVVGKLGGVLARALIRLPEQSLVGIRALPRHTPQCGLPLDDDGAQPVIMQPECAGHARGSPADDGHDRRPRHCQSVHHGISRLRLRALAWFARVSLRASPQGLLREKLMISMEFEHDLKASVRTIPDYPKPGIMFRDITTLLGNARAFRRAVDELVQPWAGSKIDKVAGIEARGFILGGAVAHQVSAGFVPIRKKGKLPHKRVSIAYSLEYGLDEMEMHEDAVEAGDRVVLVDDLIATGGTAEGAVKLLRQLGAQVLAACFIIDLPDLGGADKLRKLDVPVRTLITFEGH